ncbi:muscle M-line assembly protein unc-89-like [Ostrinia furnacalis]|uniref:muscle M-line assembly protein unc-89-like n=1 Tax=Ostrinia furnacalis TaxID=93504 RepID=UPI00103A037A|nr:muscle M-line assembly protein unc-89-like [Ostrinia furnacalis]
MKSDKFDEMAEKIADKAVEKFQKINKVTDTASVPEAIVNKEGITYRVLESDAKEPNNSESKIDDTETETKASPRPVIKKIDTEAVIKKSEDSFNDLSLKYKQFTKSVYGMKPKELDAKRLSNIEGESLEKENEMYEQNLAAKAKKRGSIGEASSMKIEPVNDRSTKLSRLIKKSVKTTPQDMNYSGDGTDTKDSEFEKDDKSIASDQKENDGPYTETVKQKASSKEQTDRSHERTLESDSSNKEDVRNNEDHSDGEYKKRKPAYEYLHLPDHSKDLDSTKSSKKDKKTTTSKQFFEEKVVPKPKEIEEKRDSSAKVDSSPVRKEGNKLYTYQKSAEYEDYHEKLASIQNQLKTTRNY